MSRTVAYKTPDTGQIYQVDAALDPRILDRLNRLPGVTVYSVCAGHRKGQGGHNCPQRAKVIFEGPPFRGLASKGPGLLRLAPYLERLSSTEYAAVVEKYRGNGDRNARWRLLVERYEYGPAPLAWWRGLVS